MFAPLIEGPKGLCWGQRQGGQAPSFAASCPATARPASTSFLDIGRPETSSRMTFRCRVVALEDSIMVFVDIDSFTSPQSSAQEAAQSWPVPPERRGKFLGVLGAWHVRLFGCAWAQARPWAPLGLAGMAGRPCVFITVVGLQSFHLWPERLWPAN